MSRQVFFDTETTGLDADNGDRIVELGCVEMIDRRLTGNDLHLYFNPERSSSPEALRIHGLTDERLAAEPRFAERAERLLSYLQGAELIIHNAAFDVGFVNAELKRLGRGPLTDVVTRITDSWQMAREMFPGKANNLDALCRRLEVDNSNRTLHGASLDARLLAEVYIRMTRGQDSLVIDAPDGGPTRLHVADVDLTAFDLPVIASTDDELAAHEAILSELDKASGGKTVWRSATVPAATV
jgi:DNA polymerase-3 subunit epsilon